MENEFERCLEAAQAGKDYLESLYVRYKPKQSERMAVLLFPERSEDFLNSAYKYLDDYLTKGGFDSALIVNSIGLDHEHMRSLTDKLLFTIDTSEQEMARLLRFASLAFMEVKTMALSSPFNQRAAGLVGFKDITMDRLVYYAIYGIIGDMGANA